jgi:HK97 gp10 family phage protein
MADFDFEVTLTGVDALNKKLEGLSYDMAKKGGRFALRKAAQVIRDQARQNARRVDDSDTGRSIAANIIEKWNGRVNKQTGNLGFRIGVNQGAVLPKKGERPDESAGGPTPHWRLLEFGTEKMPARPFMVPAMNQAAQAAADKFIVSYSQALDRALKRLGK